MEFIGHLESVTKNFTTGRNVIAFELEEGNVTEVLNLNGKKLRITAKQYREKRSLNSNAYAWHLMQEIAEKIGSTKDEVYLNMLQRYSRSFAHMIVHKEIIPKLEEEYRVVRDLGEVKVNGQVGQQVQVYFGSSTFDTKEMSVFLDGIISECKELGIEIIPQSDIDRMNAEWDIEKQKYKEGANEK